MFRTENGAFLMDLHFEVTMISPAVNAEMHRFTQHYGILHISPRKLSNEFPLSVSSNRKKHWLFSLIALRMFYECLNESFINEIYSYFQ